MQTLESLRRRIKNAKDLHSIVKTMKALAAVSIRQYDRAVEALAEYNRTTELGLYVVFSGQTPEISPEVGAHTGRVAAIVFGSDQGMVGQFNEQIAAYTTDWLEERAMRREDVLVLCVGLRVLDRLEDDRWPVEGVMQVPASATGISAMVQELLLAINTWRSETQVEQVHLFYNRSLSGASFRPHRVRLLPIDVERLRSLKTEKWNSRSLPIYTLERERLLAALIRQHLFVLLYRAFAESLASENASRLTSMQAAERNIEERLEELNIHYHNQRQTAITSELLDIVSGFEVLTSS